MTFLVLYVFAAIAYAPKSAYRAISGQMCIILLKIIPQFWVDCGLVSIFGKNMVVL
jgi:hypothetical protein